MLADSVVVLVRFAVVSIRLLRQGVAEATVLTSAEAVSDGVEMAADKNLAD